MTNRIADTSQRKAARVAGFAYHPVTYFRHVFKNIELQSLKVD